MAPRGNHLLASPSLTASSRCAAPTTCAHMPELLVAETACASQAFVLSSYTPPAPPLAHRLAGPAWLARSEYGMTGLCLAAQFLRPQPTTRRCAHARAFVRLHRGLVRPRRYAVESGATQPACHLHSQGTPTSDVQWRRVQTQICECHVANTSCRAHSKHARSGMHARRRRCVTATVHAARTIVRAPGR